MSVDLFVFAGETSGDVHGAKILDQLKKIRPDLKILGVGGPKMRAVGMDLLMPMESYQIMGYSDVFKNIFKLIHYFKKVQKTILQEKPKAVLFIDYPGFNLRMAKALRKKKFQGQLIHYICPTVWAHGKKRIYTLSSTLNLLLSIFPFEERYFKKTPLKPSYVGHPLIESALEHSVQKNWLSLNSFPENKTLIGLFPGSRSQEIKQNLPKILSACELYLKKHPNTFFVLSLASPHLQSLVHEAVKACSLKENESFFMVSSKENSQLMRHSKAAIATSGTITFELGVAKVPTVVVYHLTQMNAWVARYLIKLSLPYYCIVNIITQKHVFPELYYLDFIPENVSDTLSLLTQEGYTRQNALEGCEEMLKIMDSEKKPSRCAAEKIEALIHA